MVSALIRLVHGRPRVRFSVGHSGGEILAELLLGRQNGEVLLIIRLPSQNTKTGNKKTISSQVR